MSCVPFIPRLASSKPAANLSVWLVSLPWNEQIGWGSLIGNDPVPFDFPLLMVDPRRAFKLARDYDHRLVLIRQDLDPVYATAPSSRSLIIDRPQGVRREMKHHAAVAGLAVLFAFCHRLDAGASSLRSLIRPTQVASIQGNPSYGSGGRQRAQR